MWYQWRIQEGNFTGGGIYSILESGAFSGVGSRGQLKGPGGVQGQSPWWGSRGEAPGSLWIVAILSSSGGISWH